MEEERTADVVDGAHTEDPRTPGLARQGTARDLPGFSKALEDGPPVDELAESQSDRDAPLSPMEARQRADAEAQERLRAAQADNDAREAEIRARELDVREAALAEGVTPPRPSTPPAASPFGTQSAPAPEPDPEGVAEIVEAGEGESGEDSDELPEVVDVVDDTPDTSSADDDDPVVEDSSDEDPGQEAAVDDDEEDETPGEFSFEQAVGQDPFSQQGGQPEADDDDRLLGDEEILVSGESDEDDSDAPEEEDSSGGASSSEDWVMPAAQAPKTLPDSDDEADDGDDDVARAQRARAAKSAADGDTPGTLSAAASDPSETMVRRQRRERSKDDAVVMDYRSGSKQVKIDSTLFAMIEEKLSSMIPGSRGSDADESRKVSNPEMINAFIAASLGVNMVGQTPAVTRAIEAFANADPLMGRLTAMLESHAEDQEIIGAILGVIYQKTLSIEDSTWFSKYASAFLVGDRVGGGFSPEVTSIEQGFEDFDLTHEEIEAFVADQQRASRKTLDAETIASAARLDANARERLREDMSRRIVDLGEGGSE